MKVANYHLTLTDSDEEFYFYHEWVKRGDILRVGRYRVVVIDKSYDDSSYTELTAIPVNEEELIITEMR